MKQDTVSPGTPFPPAAPLRLGFVNALSLALIVAALAGAAVYLHGQAKARGAAVSAYVADEQAEDQAMLDLKSGQVSGILRQVAQDARYIASLPEVRGISGKNPQARIRRPASSEAAEALARVHRALSNGLPVSGIYCVLKGFRPDLSGQDPLGERPYVEVGEISRRSPERQSDFADGRTSGFETIRYAWLKEQVERFARLVPMRPEDATETVPPAVSTAFVTRDDDPGTTETVGNTQANRGFLVAVPFFDRQGRYSGIVAVAFQRFDFAAAMAGSGGRLRGRFVLSRKDSDLRLTEFEGRSLWQDSLAAPQFFGADLDLPEFPGWEIHFRRDLAELAAGIAAQEALFSRRAQTVVVLVAAFAGGVLLFRRLLLSNRALRVRVAELKEARERLAEQARLIFEARHPIYVLDPALRVRFWNQAAEQLYGVPAAEAVGKPLAEALAPRLAGEAAGFPDAREIARVRRWSGEIEYRKSDGKALCVESFWAATLDAHGALDGFFVVDFDITEKKSYEVQLRRSQRMENLGALAGGVAHDLNNALTPVIVGLQMLRAASTEEERDALVGTVLSSAQRGTAMVRQILGFVRGTQGEDGPVQVRHLVEEMAGIVRDTFPKAVSVDVRIARGLPNVMGNATELHQVLLNLCVNARDAMMPQGGRLLLEAETSTLDAKALVQAKREGVAPGEFVVLAVTDSGSGIPAHVLPRIFDPLFTTKEPGKGTGLGLSTVAGIVRRMGGFIEVKSRPGCGARFVVHLPAARTGTGVEGISEDGPEAKSVPPTLPVGHGEGILLVDDDNTVRRLAKAMLQNYGYRVVTATNGLEAVSLFERQENEIRLIVSDVDMPYMSGPELAATIHRRRPDLPIVLVSGSELSEAQFAGIKRGSLGFLIKPYTVEGLIVEVGRHTGAQVPPPSKRIDAPLTLSEIGGAI